MGLEILVWLGKRMKFLLLVILVMVVSLCWLLKFLLIIEVGVKSIVFVWLMGESWVGSG